MARYIHVILHLGPNSGIGTNTRVDVIDTSLDTVLVS